MFTSCHFQKVPVKVESTVLESLNLPCRIVKDVGEIDSCGDLSHLYLGVIQLEIYSVDLLH